MTFLHFKILALRIRRQVAGLCASGALSAAKSRRGSGGIRTCSELVEGIYSEPVERILPPQSGILHLILYNAEQNGHNNKKQGITVG
jgi:hypothetical protein